MSGSAREVAEAVHEALGPRSEATASVSWRDVWGARDPYSASELPTVCVLVWAPLPRYRRWRRDRVQATYMARAREALRSVLPAHVPWEITWSRVLVASRFACQKRAARARRLAERRARREWRRTRRRCFWSWPWGHRYETPDGRGSLEAFSGASDGGARPNLRCVGCGRGFGLGEADRGSV